MNVKTFLSLLELFRLKTFANADMKLRDVNCPIKVPLFVSIEYE